MRSGPLPPVLYRLWPFSYGKEISSIFVLGVLKQKKLPHTPLIVPLIVLQEIIGLPIMRRIERHKAYKTYLLLFKVTVFTLFLNLTTRHGVKEKEEEKDENI